MDKKYEALRLTNQLCFPLYASAKEIVRRYRPFLKEIGLTYTQYIVMMVLWEEGECSVKKIGDRLRLDSGTLTPVLKSLEASGFIVRLRSQEDERFLLIRPTDCGYELRERALAVPPKISSCVNLEPAEAVELYRLLYKILDK